MYGYSAHTCFGPDGNVMDKDILTKRLRVFLDNEARSCSMDFGCVTPLYVYRMWGGQVPYKDISVVFDEMKRVRNIDETTCINHNAML